MQTYYTQLTKTSCLFFYSVLSVYRQFLITPNTQKGTQTMTTPHLTELESSYLRFLATSESEFNGDKLDFSKPWEKQSLESGTFYTYPRVYEFSDMSGRSTAGVRALLSNLSRKGYIMTGEDGFLEIDQEQFFLIKDALGL